MALKGERQDKPTYTKITPVDIGNTGVGYTSEHELFNRKTFQKTISLLGLEDGVAYDEPRFLKTFDNDFIVDVWEAQWDPDPQWRGVKAITLVMPLYEGGSIQDALDEGHAFSVGAAVDVTCGVLDALHYLHVNERVLHREVKARNVMLDADRRHPYVGDFGTAVRIPAGQETAGVVSSAALSRPPESHTGVYSPKGDVYGAGMVLLECLNGRLPYEQLDRDRMEERLGQGKHSVVARLLKPAPHVPPSVGRILKKMLGPDPDRRPTALQAQRALERAEHLDWQTRADGDHTVWDGRWPPAGREGHGRVYEVRAQPINSGRYRGEMLLSARWRRVGTVDWRHFKSLERRVSPGDTVALARFFRDAEAAAHKSAAA